MGFSFTDYFSHTQNIQTMNKFIEFYLKQNEAQDKLLNAIKEYYKELKGTHFFYIPFFDDFLDYILNNNKLLKEYSQKLIIKNIK